uniref:CCHC-type domain-containing protein n=1 Tax=Tanacetum cinerariifolium TaxID=118510 RepID=A0A6L2LGH8_TANCI|nr:hypothetical protein [Tanacetum cinerariifolium]
MWKAIERLKQGESINVQVLETNLYWEFGKFTSQDGESLESYYSRFYKIMNELIKNQCKVTNHQVNVQFLLQLQPEWQRFVTLAKQSQELQTVSYHKLYDILKQHQHEVNEIRAENIARVANPRALVAQQQPVYHPQTHPNHYKHNSSTRSQQAATRNIGKAIDNSPRINRNAGYESQRIGNVAGARETVGSSMVQKSRIQCYNYKDFGHVSKECQKPKREKDAAYHREKMLLCKQEEAGIQLNAEQAIGKMILMMNLMIKNWKHIICTWLKFKRFLQMLLTLDLSLTLIQNKSKQIDQNDEDADLAKERELLASLIEKLKCEINESKNRNKFLETSNKVLIDKLDKDIDKLMALISLSFKKIYKPINNNLRSSSNTSRANQDNSPRINRSVGYENQRIGNVAGAKETVEKRMDESISWDQKCKSSKELFKIKKSVDTIFDGVERCKQTIAKRTYFGHIDPFIQNAIEGNFCPEIQRINADLEKFHLCLKEEMVADLRYFNSLELEVDSLKSQLETQKTQFLNEIDRLLRDYYYVDHINAILELSKSKMMSKSFEALQKHAINLELDLQQYLKAQLQDKGIAISELKKLIEKLKGKSVETKFEKSSVIRQPNAFKSQRPSILRKPTIFLDSLKKKDCSMSKSVTKNNVSNDFLKPVTAQILPLNKKSILKNTIVLAPGMYKLHTEPTQTRTTQLPHDIRKTNKRVSFSIGVIPPTSVSRPPLKSNQLTDRVMLNNSQGKKQEVEDHRRNFKFSNNKTFVTACNDSLNAKTSNVNFVCVTCRKCVLNDKHDMRVLHSLSGMNSRTKMPMVVPISSREPKRTINQSVATPLRRTVASESTNQKPRHTTRKLYESVSKTCSWWYPKFTPPGSIH